jgi:hypothetical protein
MSQEPLKREFSVGPSPFEERFQRVVDQKAEIQNTAKKLKEKQMLKTIAVLSLPLFLLSPAYAQEEIVDNIAVELGVISWTDIEKELKGKPKTHTGEYHIKMAKKMAAMHGGGIKDEYHILIVLIDRSSNTHIGDAHVEVTAKAKTGPEQVTHKLQHMTMNNFSGYGEYFRLSYHVPYIFEVKFSLKGQEKVYTVEFERSP